MVTPKASNITEHLLNTPTTRMIGVLRVAGRPTIVVLEPLGEQPKAPFSLDDVCDHADKSSDRIEDLLFRAFHKQCNVRMIRELIAL